MQRWMNILMVVSAVVVLGESTASFAAVPPAKGTPTQPAVNNSKRSIAVVFATDNHPTQPAIDFYKAVYQALSISSTWEVMSFASMRRALTHSGDTKHLGGIPVIDRESFRKKLPRKAKKSAPAKIIPGGAVPDLQRLLDNVRSPAAIVVDCSRKNDSILKACALYYYDRVSSRVVASVVKVFLAGASDATVWAAPMLNTLEEGISGAQREKDLAVIEELVARNEDDDEPDASGLIAVFGRGDRVQLSSGWHQTIAGGGLQLGFLNDNVGAYAEYSLLSWSGSGAEISKATRTSMGLSMMFRAHALESLLWFFEIGGGKETTTFSGLTNADRLDSTGVFSHITPGVGVELAEFCTLNLGVGWRWYFGNSTSQSGALSNTDMEDSRIPSIALRAMLLL